MAQLELTTTQIEKIVSLLKKETEKTPSSHTSFCKGLIDNIEEQLNPIEDDENFSNYNIE